MKENERTLNMSVRGGFINDLALEKCHIDYDICYAVDLLMSCLQTDQISEADRLMLVLRILNGEVELRGTYPSNDYGPVELESRNAKYDLRATLSGMKGKIQAQAQEIDRLNRMLACCGEQLNDSGMREVNRSWRNQWGEKGAVFSGVEPDRPVMSQMLDEFLERTSRPDSDRDYGWLEPSGRFHVVPFGEHQGWAYQKVKELGLEDISYASGHDGDILLERGWVLLDSPSMGFARATVSNTKPLTKAQRDFLFDYYTERDRYDLAKKYLEE